MRAVSYRMIKLEACLGVMRMSKRTVTRLFAASVAALAAGLVLVFSAGALAYANGNFVMNGPEVVGVRSSPFGWVMLSVAVVALVTIFGAFVAQIVAWIGALVNTAQLDDKTWFVVLLAAGLLSVGFIAMLIYILAVPADRRPARPAASGTEWREPVR
jgi:amino acid transporter